MEVAPQPLETTLRKPSARERVVALVRPDKMLRRYGKQVLKFADTFLGSRRRRHCRVQNVLLEEFTD